MLQGEPLEPGDRNVPGLHLARSNVPCQQIPTFQSPLYSYISTHPPKKLNKSQPESTLLFLFFALPIFNFRCSMPISPIQSPILKVPSSPK